MWTARFDSGERSSVLPGCGRIKGSRQRASANAGGGLCIAVVRKESPSQRKRVPNFAAHSRVANSTRVSNTGCSSPPELEMTFSTSEVAVCCSSASSRSRVSLATSVSWLVADKLGLRSFGALRRFGARRVGGALERRLMVAPEGSASYRAKISPRRGGLHSWIDQLNGWHMSANGIVRPAPCPASDESGKGLQRQRSTPCPRTKTKSDLNRTLKRAKPPLASGLVGLGRI